MQFCVKSIFNSSIIAVLLFFSQSGLSQVLTPSHQFIPNKGQIVDVNQNFRQDVLFKSADDGIYLRKTGVSFVQAASTHDLPDLDFESKLFGSESTVQNSIPPTYKRHQVDLEFLNTNSKVEILTRFPTSDYQNYYHAHCPNGILGVNGYHTVYYKNLYKSIDVVFNNQNGLKYDFVIHPGGNYKDIKMAWIGADDVRVNGGGELVISTRFKDLTEQMPLVYQLINEDTVKINARYVLEQSNEAYFVQFKLGRYDKRYDLIIDPWVTNYGGSNIERGLEVDTDSEGNIYLSGETYSVTAIADAGFQLVNGGGTSDCFLVKFNALGERQWATYYGGTGSGANLRERGNGVATDSEGNVYLGGITSSTSAIASAGAFQTDYGGGLFDGFIAKFDADGARLWSTYFGGAEEEYAMNVGVDGLDNVYLCGYTFTETGMAFEGHQETFGGFADGFVVKFNSVGDRIWSTYYGGVNAEIVHDVEGDELGNVFVSGVTTSAEGISSPGAFQEDAGGGQDAFLVKFNADGSRDWGTYYGQLWVERGDAIAIDTTGNVYMGGKNTAPDGGASPGAFQTSGGGTSDGFLSKYNSEGTQLWATYLGGDSIDYVFGVDVDPISNNAVVSGDTYSEDFPTAPCAEQDEKTGFLSGFVTRFLPDGDLYCSSYFGIEHEEENVLAVHDCWVYVGGTTEGNMSTPGAHQTTPGGDLDAYLGRVHIASCESTIPDIITFEQEQVDVTSCTPCNGSATIDISAFCIPSEALKTYVWSNGVVEQYTTATTSTIEGICEGEYWVEVTLNCDQIDTFYFDISNSASITAEFNMESVCVGEIVSFENTSSTIFGDIIRHNWDFGDGNFSDLINPDHTYDSPGTYEVKLEVENDSECIDSLILTVEIFPDYDIVIDTTVCKDDIFVYPDGESILANENETRSFDLLSATDCDSMVTINVMVTPHYEIEQSVSVEFGDTYTFPDGSGTVVFNDLMQTSNLSTSENCDSIIITNITVIIPPEVPVISSFIAPNIFTPGQSNDFNNTFFFPAEGINEFECVVTNRWGNEVFRFTTISDQWNGTNAQTGANCPDGVYFYSYTGKTVGGEQFSGHGTVQLVRD